MYFYYLCIAYSLTVWKWKKSVFNQVLKVLGEYISIALFWFVVIYFFLTKFAMFFFARIKTE